MENLRNRRREELVTSEEKLKKLAAQPSFKQFKIFHENLVAVERAKVELTLNRLMWDLPSWTFRKRWCMISIPITSSENIQIRRCYLPIQIPLLIKFKRITCMKTSMPMQTIRSFKHQLYTMKQNKVSRSPYNNKRYLMDDGVHSLPYRHFSLW